MPRRTANARSYVFAVNMLIKLLRGASADYGCIPEVNCISGLRITEKRRINGPKAIKVPRKYLMLDK